MNSNRVCRTLVKTASLFLHAIVVHLLLPQDSAELNVEQESANVWSKASPYPCNGAVRDLVDPLTPFCNELGLVLTNTLN